MLCIQLGFPASPAVASLYNNNSVFVLSDSGSESCEDFVLHSVHRQTPASRRLISRHTLGYHVYCWSAVGATSRPKITQEGASNEIVSQNMRDYDSKDN